MRSNSIQFAVVREGPEIEHVVIGNRSIERVLLIASGGCTALSLQAWWPDVSFTLVDANAAQLALVRRKIEALATGITPDTLRLFNVGSADPNGLSQCGNFESLFRGLRMFIHEFVASADEIDAWFDPATPREKVAEVFAHPYWPVAFELYFSDSLLGTMFGSVAIQHATPGSYPRYFRAMIERGLMAAHAHENYFLHHIFLGAYRPGALPPFLVQPARDYRFDWIEGPIDKVPDLDSYDLVNLSNIMDWMSAEEALPMVERLRAQMRVGGTVIWRQLNNDRNRQSWFGDGFTFDGDRDARLATADRSIFYSSIHVGTKKQ